MGDFFPKGYETASILTLSLEDSVNNSILNHYYMFTIYSLKFFTFIIIFPQQNIKIIKLYEYHVQFVNSSSFFF